MSHKPYRNRHFRTEFYRLRYRSNGEVSRGWRTRKLMSAHLHGKGIKRPNRSRH